MPSFLRSSMVGLDRLFMVNFSIERPITSCLWGTRYESHRKGHSSYSLRLSGMILASAMKTISLTQLLSSCMDASRQGCEIIQDFHRKSMAGGTGRISGTLKEGDEIKSVVTQADFDAQARIVGALRQTWGDALRIIGEEDEEDAKPILDGVSLDRHILSVHSLLDEEIPLDDLALFVDPLDGTREFVEGRLENVACLIGIARNNRPIAGVIGLPFPEGSGDKAVRVHYAISGQAGSAGTWPAQTKSQDSGTYSSETITILTGDSKDPLLVNATHFAKSLTERPNHVLVGGTAAKLHIVATQPNSIAILHFKTQLWDTCAPQALIESNGGKVTDLFGSPLVHAPDRKFGNIYGVVASSGQPQVTSIHDELCAKMRADTKSPHNRLEDI